MGTRGVISIVRDGETVIKAVCGCDGYNDELLVKAIEQLSHITADIIYAEAERVKFGCPACLVVSERVGDGSVRHKTNGASEDLTVWYSANFADPESNPRWKRGTGVSAKVIRWLPHWMYNERVGLKPQTARHRLRAER